MSSDDPRFIIADFAVSPKCNLFTYGKNDFVDFLDLTGTDAIWLQATQEVFKMGHVGLMIEKNRFWYYWYWGADFGKVLPTYACRFFILSSLFPIYCSLMQVISSNYKNNFCLRTFPLLSTLWATLSASVSAISKLEVICSSDYMSYLRSNARYGLSVKDFIKRRISYNFNHYFYIKGAFESGFNYLSAMHKYGLYNLLQLNCMQTSVYALLRGRFGGNHRSIYKQFSNAKSLIIPNLAFNYLKKTTQYKVVSLDA